MSSKFYVYLLLCSDNSTYIGATVNLNHRLRQHNCEIKGGAVATSRKVKKGEIWKRACYVENFPSWKAALQFEWAWKFYSRKLSRNMTPIERRRKALNNLLSLDKPTSKSILYSEWETPINVIWT
jgi:predicted GIY-YIG superfamily endonuclease